MVFEDEKKTNKQNKWFLISFYELPSIHTHSNTSILEGNILYCHMAKKSLDDPAK